MNFLTNSSHLEFPILREDGIEFGYDIAGAKCQLVVTPDTITIRSPGEPVLPITVKQLQDFNAPMLSRNPVLHYVSGSQGERELVGHGPQMAPGEPAAERIHP